MMRDVASELADSFEEKGLKLLVQGGQIEDVRLREFDVPDSQLPCHPGGIGNAAPAEIDGQYLDIRV